MQDIDFLPSDLKRRRTNRHGRSWQIITVGAAIALLVVVAIGQSRAQKQIKERLAKIEPERRLLDARQEQLAELRERLSDTKARAKLIAYMDHPWPKTQLLAATLRSLPDAVVYDRIRISHDTRPERAPLRRTSEAEEEDPTTLEPAVRDVRLLREECDFAVVAIALEGMTTDGIELHRYLDRLNRVPLLDKVELQTLESANEESGARFHFEARLTVRPGFGQPNGPNGRSSHLAQATLPGQPIASEPHQP